MINTVTLLGRLTKDVEISKAQTGTTVARFTVAVDKRKSGKKEASFIPCKAFGTTAETISKYFSKGSEIGVTGYLDTWMVESESGSKRYGIDVIVNEFSFTSGTKVAQNASNEATEQGWEREPTEYPIDSDELPF